MSDTDWTIAVVCTDRRSHKPVPITHVNRRTDADGTVRRSMWAPGSAGNPWWYPPDPNAEPGGGVSRESYQFDCPKCGRHVLVNQERWWSSLRTMIEQSDLREIDISLL